MEAFVTKGIHLPSLEELLARQQPIPAAQGVLSPWVHPKYKDLPEAEKRRLWERGRDKGVGASDVPIIRGTSKFMSAYRLACLKSGRVKREEEDESEHLVFGHRMESVAVQFFTEQARAKVWNPQSIGIRNPRYEWNIATPDRFVMLAGENPFKSAAFVPQEIKNVGEYMKGDWETCRIPEMYYDQVQDQMACTGAIACIVLAIVGGNKFWPYTVLRDEAHIGVIERDISRFWSNLQEGVLPPVDESESTADTLKEIFAKAGKGVKPLTPEAMAQAMQYLKLSGRESLFKKAAQACADRKALIANQLREFMGEDLETEVEEGVEMPKISWKPQEAKKVNQRAMEADQEVKEATIALARAKAKHEYREEVRVLRVTMAKPKKKK